MPVCVELSLEMAGQFQFKGPVAATNVAYRAKKNNGNVTRTTELAGIWERENPGISTYGYLVLELCVCYDFYVF